LNTTAWTTTRNGKLALTGLYYVAFVALGLAAASLGPTLNGLAQHTRSALSDISYLFTARSLGYLVGSVVGGRLYDKLPGHIVMAGMFVVIALALALAPVVPLLGLLFIVILFLGAGQGAVDVGGNALLVWVHRSEVGPFMNGLHFAWGAGAALSPIVIAQAVLRSGDITWGYWALMLVTLPVILALTRFASPAAQASSQSGASAPINRGLVLLIALFFFLYVGAEGSFGGWVFTYAFRQGLADQAAAAYLTSAFWGSLTVGRLLAIPLAIRLRPRYVLLSDLVLCLISMGLIVLLPGSLPAVWAGTFGLGLGMASIFPTMISWAERRMTLTGQVTSLFFVGSSLGGMSIPWLIGQLFEPVGPRVAMLIITVDLVAALGVFIALMLASRQVASSAEARG